MDTLQSIYNAWICLYTHNHFVYILQYLQLWLIDYLMTTVQSRTISIITCVTSHDVKLVAKRIPLNQLFRILYHRAAWKGLFRMTIRKIPKESSWGSPLFLCCCFDASHYCVYALSCSAHHYEHVLSRSCIVFTRWWDAHHVELDIHQQLHFFKSICVTEGCATLSCTL